jgi:hypothetical protein
MKFRFQDMAYYDFRLITGSPLIDAGYDLSTQVPDDFDGNPRPKKVGFDVGAFEVQNYQNLVKLWVPVVRR